MKEKIVKIIFEALKDLNEELNSSGLTAPDINTCLFGVKSVLDSMALVALIADIEGRIATEFGRDIVLADERAMSQQRSPFRDVGTLADYIQSLLEEERV